MSRDTRRRTSANSCKSWPYTVVCYRHLGGAFHSSAGFNGHRALTVLRCSGYSAQLGFSGKECSMDGPSPALLSRTGLFFGRSFFPLFAVTMIAGVALWGPWVSLGVIVIAIAAALRQL